jgi:hypothetical protein
MLWPQVAELPLVVQACEYDRLHAVLAHESERMTTHVRLIGAGADGRRGHLGAPRRRQLSSVGMWPARALRVPDLAELITEMTLDGLTSLKRPASGAAQSAA